MKMNAIRFGFEASQVFQDYKVCLHWNIIHRLTVRCLHRTIIWVIRRRGAIGSTLNCLTALLKKTLNTILFCNELFISMGRNFSLIPLYGNIYIFVKKSRVNFGPIKKKPNFGMFQTFKTKLWVMCFF